MQQDWQTRCAERKAKQLASIPKEWLITLPPEDQRNVLDVPKTCGLLTAREWQITETTDVDVLLSKLATRVWSSVEVTLAFYKRAVIAQQLVRTNTPVTNSWANIRFSRSRPIALQRFSLSKLWHAPAKSTVSYSVPATPLVPYTACQSRSRTNSA